MHNSDPPALAAICEYRAGISPPEPTAFPGAVYQLMLTSAAAIIGGHAQPNCRDFAAGLEAGLESVQFYGGARPGHRTLLDALRPVCAFLQGTVAGRLGECRLTAEDVREAAQIAADGAEATASMVAQAGRSSYVNAEVVKGVRDPGAAAVAIWVRALCEELEGVVGGQGD